MNIKLCNKCGFILNTRPGLSDINGVCSACINSQKKKNIDFKSRQKWLQEFIRDSRRNSRNKNYECLIAVSGGKDSTSIVARLFEVYGIKKALLVHLEDDFTKTQAGSKNLRNIIEKFNCDLININLNPAELASQMKKDFIETLNPLRFLEEQIYKKPLEIAKKFDIDLVFYGENSAFEYGSAEELEIFHPATEKNLNVIYLGAVHPYSAEEWLKHAKQHGFIDLNDTNEWQRQGQIENYSQIDSIGYHMGIWTKFVKFGFQRVSDIACRQVREGKLTLNQAKRLIEDKDYICDPASKRDFCRTIGITEDFFDTTVDRHANQKIVKKDINGVWKRIDLQ